MSMHTPSGPPLRVLAITGTTITKTPTWRLRVEILIPLLRGHGIEVTPLHLPREHNTIRACLDATSPFDVAWLHRKILWPSELKRLERKVRAIVLDIDDPVNISSSRFAHFSLPRCLKFRATARRSAAIVAACDGLVDIARRHNPNVYYEPLCMELEQYSLAPRSRAAGEPLKLLWLGGPSTFKYLEQIRPHLEMIGKALSHITLTVVGHSQLVLENMPVTNLAWSPATERTELDSAQVGLVPLADNRWTRAKAALKPLQYLASGMPFIGSPVGVNKRFADGGRNGLLAKTPDEWCAAVKRLEQDEDLRQRMGQNGVEYVRKNHAPGVLAAKVAEVFHSVARRLTYPLAG